MQKSAIDRSWPFGKLKASWTGAELQDDGTHTRRSYIELEDGKGKSGNTMTSPPTGQYTTESASRETGAIESQK